MPNRVVASASLASAAPFTTQRLDRLYDEARRLNCDQLELDSAIRPEHDDVYRVCVYERLAIRAMHFTHPLS